MSGIDCWPLPTNWRSERLKYLARLNQTKLPESTSPETLIRYVDISAVHGDGSRDDPQDLTFESAPSRARRIAQAGDTVISTVRTYLRAITYVEPHARGYVWSTGFATVSPERIHPKYLFYVARSEPFLAEIASRSVGVSYPAVNASDIADIRCPLPPIGEQRRIADFLDDELSRLEVMALARESAADCVRQRLETSLLRQLIPGSKAWHAGSPLQHVTTAVGPAAWRPRRLKHTVESVVGGIWGAELNEGEEATSCARVADFDYAVGRLRPFIPTARSISHAERQARLLRVGDLLLEKSGGGDQQPVGRVVAVEATPKLPAVCSNFISRLRPKPPYDPHYLQLLHRALYFSGITRLSVKQTTGIQNLDVSHYLSRTVAIPPLDEQRRLTTEMTKEVDAERRVVSRIADERGLLGERQQALITAAVTGQIDPSSYRRPRELEAA